MLDTSLVILFFINLRPRKTASLKNLGIYEVESKECVSLCPHAQCVAAYSSAEAQATNLSKSTSTDPHRKLMILAMISEGWRDVPEVLTKILGTDSF